MKYAVVKRLFDLILCGILLIPFSCLSILIVLVSVFFFGPNLLFVHKRTGYKNRTFNLYKFTTLFPAKVSEEKNPLSDEERQNAWGKFLRDYSLDEIPQIINVLRGDMSWIGPRPLLPQYLSIYSSRQKERHLVKPGITGLAQIFGRNELSLAQKVRYDLIYVKRLSFQLDVFIFLITIKVLLRGQKTNFGAKVYLPVNKNSEVPC